MPTYELSDLTVNVDFECHETKDESSPMIKYQATVVFPSLEKLLLAGGESVTRKLQTQARSKNGFPKGRRVVVDELGKYAMTKEEKLNAAMAQISALDPNDEKDEAQLEAMFKIYQEKKAAKLAAEKAAKKS